MSEIFGGDIPLIKDDVAVLVGGISIGISTSDLPQTIKFTYEA